MFEQLYFLMDSKLLCQLFYLGDCSGQLYSIGLNFQVLWVDVEIPWIIT